MVKRKIEKVNNNNDSESNKDMKIKKKETEYYMWHDYQSDHVCGDNNSDHITSCGKNKWYIFIKASGNNKKMHEIIKSNGAYNGLYVSDDTFTSMEIESIKKFSKSMVPDNCYVYDIEISLSNIEWLTKKIRSNNPIQYVWSVFEFNDNNNNNNGGGGKEVFVPFKKYWNNEGKLQKQYDDMWESKIPSSGSCEKYPETELLRAVNKLYLSYYHSGCYKHSSFSDLKKAFTKSGPIIEKMNVSQDQELTALISTYRAIFDDIEFQKVNDEGIKSSIFFRKLEEVGKYAHQKILEDTMNLAIRVATSK